MRPLLVFAAVFCPALQAAALDPQPGDAYFFTREVAGAEVYHVAADTGATTLVARDGYIMDVYTNTLSAGPDGHLCLAQEREGPTAPGRLVRIDPNAFDPGNPVANQVLVLEDGLADDIDALTALPGPAGPSVALAPGWAQWLGAAALLWIGGHIGRRAPRSASR